MPESLARLSRRCHGLIAELRRRHGRRLSLLFSLLSIIWGIVSGIGLSRDYHESARLAGYMAMFVVVSAAFRMWLEFAARRSAARGDLAPGATGRVLGFMLERPRLVEGAALFATQIAVQYISMFCLPLLFFARAWISLGLAASLSVISLIDPWWNLLARHPLGMAAVRAFVAAMAVAFSFAVFFPAALAWYYPVLATVVLLCALPWQLVVARTRPAALDAVPLFTALCLVLVSLLTKQHLHFPLLSVWLDQPRFGLSIAHHELVETWGAVEARDKLDDALENEEEICCLTPVVSPSGVDQEVIHEWLVDDQVIDRISLSPVRGSGEVNGKNHAFRTFSCKQHVPVPLNDSVHTLSCRVYLGPGIYLGRAEVRLEPS